MQKRQRQHATEVSSVRQGQRTLRLRQRGSMRTSERESVTKLYVRGTFAGGQSFSYLELDKQPTEVRYWDI